MVSLCVFLVIFSFVLSLLDSSSACECLEIPVLDSNEVVLLGYST